MTPARHLVLGMVLTGAAGFVDAIGFIELGGFFTSFMSGNTTQGGAALINGAWPVVGLTLSLVVLFFIGSVLGNLLAFSNMRWGPAAVSGGVALGVTGALVLVLLGHPPGQSMLVLAAAAGAQNAILPMRGAVRQGATFVTGTLSVAGPQGQGAALALGAASGHLAGPPGRRGHRRRALWPGGHLCADAAGAGLCRVYGRTSLGGAAGMKTEPSGHARG